MTTIRWERTISDAITTARATGRPILVHYTEAPRCEACAKLEAALDADASAARRSRRIEALLHRIRIRVPDGRGVGLERFGSK